VRISLRESRTSAGPSSVLVGGIGGELERAGHKIVTLMDVQTFMFTFKVGLAGSNNTPTQLNRSNPGELIAIFNDFP
jgi:hypothetical protein